MSVTADLFIGLVTHPRSRYPRSAGPEGLARSLAASLVAEGMTVEVRVHDQDAWTPDLLEIDKEQVARSIDAELDVEARWRVYLNPRTNRFTLRAAMAVRRILRRRRYLPRAAVSDPEHPGVRMVRRLVNIEIAHLSLLRQAHASGAPWALTLEDDAQGDPAHVARTLKAVMIGSTEQEPPQYVNVSRSFEAQELGIEHLLVDLGPLPGCPEVHVQSAERPVTNTVCAVLYSGTFLQALVPALDAIPPSPVIPIDWKLNEAIMRLSADGVLQSGSCWLISPAPIAQGSMHA